MTSSFEEQTMINIRNLASRVTNLEAQEQPIVAALYTQTSGATTLTTGTMTVIDFDTKVYDTRSAVATGASWAFTAPIAGYYLVGASVRLATDGDWALDMYAVMKVYVNGADYRTIHFFEMPYVAAAGTYSYIMNMHGSCVVHLAAGDTVDVRASQNTGGNVNTDNTATKTWVNICKLVS